MNTFATTFARMSRWLLGGAAAGLLAIAAMPAQAQTNGTAKQSNGTAICTFNGFSFDSLMLQDKDRKPDQPRLLAVDNEIVVPVNKVVRVQVIGADVIHAFAVPSFGIKIDAVPGRLNETWFRATREGMFYGQCSELCGKDHAFMPIVFRVVSEQKYAEWLAAAKKKYASANDREKALTFALADASR